MLTFDFEFHRAAAIATGCEIEIKIETAYFDLHQNNILGEVEHFIHTEFPC